MALGSIAKFAMASHYDDHLSVSFSANSGGNNRVLMMDNGMVAGEDENLETSEAQPLLQQRYEQKKEGEKDSSICFVLHFLFVYSS